MRLNYDPHHHHIFIYMVVVVGVIGKNGRRTERMKNSKIEWTTHTINLWHGCVEVSPGCDNCYARELSKRFGRAKWGVEEPVWFPDKKRIWRELDQWNLEAAVAGRRDRVFVNSMADIFDLHTHDGDWREIADRATELFDRIYNWPNLIFLLLTKRIGNAAACLPPSWRRWSWPRNVWMGISVVNQTEADRDIPKLLKLPAPVRFLSIEPMLGPITLWTTDSLPRVGPGVKYQYACRQPEPPHLRGKTGHSVCEIGIHWVIAGGESGAQARPGHPDWFRSLRDQCQAAGVAFFFKQWGEWIDNYNVDTDWWNSGGRDQVRGSVNLGNRTMHKVGKHQAGRLLDGRTWDELPQEALA